MKSVSLFICLSIIFPYWCVAQITFEKSYGGNNNDFGFSVKQTWDGGYILLGNTENSGTDSKDLYLIKTDISGIEEWSKIFEAPVDQYGFEVEVLNGGGYILCGKSMGLEDSVILVKTDDNGNEVWNKRFPSGDGNAVEQSMDNGVAVVGRTTTDTSYILLIKTDENGNLLWSKTYSKGIGKDLKRLSDGYIIIGETRDSMDNGYDLILVRTDLAGNLEWSKTFNISSDALWTSIDTTNDHGFVLTGGDNFPAPFGSAYIMKTDSAGNQLWLKWFGEGGAKAFSISKTSDGSYVAAGDQGLNPDSLHGMSLIKVDGDGNLIWKQVFQNGSYGESVCQTTDEGYIILGRTDDSYGYVNYFLIKTDMNGYVSVTDPEIKLFELTITPNPFSDETRISFSKNDSRDVSMDIRDVFGRKIQTVKHMSGTSLIVKKGELLPGIYLLTVYDQHRLVATKKLIVE